jgi:predicted component of type VI protein secretion system
MAPAYLARLLRNRIYLTTHADTFRERLEEMGLTISINIMRTLLNVTKKLV